MRAKPPCKQCGVRPVRQRRAASFCTPCVSKMPKKTCSVCSAAFAPDMMSTNTRCRQCSSTRSHEKRVMETYGLGPGQYAELLEYQGGVSAISRQKPHAKRLAVDHHHGTGEVRGLLTKHENFYLIGWLETFDDPIAVLERAIEYLRESPARKLWGDQVPKSPV